MEVYSTEEEQLEAIRRWWQENGRALLTGIAVVLLAVFGWRSWQGYQAGQAETASAHYQQMLSLLDSNPQAAADQARGIVAEYPSTTYGAFASLALARIAQADGDLAQAEAHLRRVGESGGAPELRQVARLRLGRVLLAQGKPDEALAQVQQGASGSFEPMFEELKGDIHLAKGQRAEARAAYGNALAGYKTPGKQDLVRMKLENLADAQGNAA